MIQAVAEHISTRLSGIKADGEPVKYYAQGAARPKALTEFPCIAGSWYLPPAPDLGQIRPQFEVFIASEEQQTVAIPEWLGGGERTGPAEWTVKPYPVPHRMHLQLDVLSAVEGHAIALALLLIEAFPMPYRFELADGRWALMLPDGDPINLDELEAPLFRTAYRYEISNVWTERQPEYVVPSVGQVDSEYGAY